MFGGAGVVVAGAPQGIFAGGQGADGGFGAEPAEVLLHVGA
jgi:hypothetical protein